MRADRRQCPDPSRLQHRTGRLRFRVLWPGRPFEGAADRPGADPERCGNRRRNHHRSRQPARYRHRRGHQNRQSGPDRPQCEHRQALPAGGPDRARGQPDDRGQCGARRQGRDQQPSSDRRWRPGNGDECGQGRHSTQRTLGWSLREADQAVVQGDPRGGTPGARWQVRPEGRGAGVMEEAPVKFALVDINEILKTLPHRYPMLLIDRVVNIRTDYSGIGVKNVTFNEVPFLGHFPERPVYPGVMMIEAMAQTAGVIGIKSVEGTEKPRAVYFLTIDKCKFRKPVLPGDIIEYHMRSIGRRKTMWWFHGDAIVNGTTVAEADVGAMLTD